MIAWSFFLSPVNPQAIAFFERNFYLWAAVIFKILVPNFSFSFYVFLTQSGPSKFAMFLSISAFDLALIAF
jgi:hypothetical protein